MADDQIYDEQGLLQLAAAGDRQAFHQLFDKYWDQVYGVCLHLTKSPEPSKDLSQDIFLKLWENRSGLASVRNLGGYIHTVSKHLVLDYLRTQVFRQSNHAFLTTYFSTEVASPLGRLEQRELGGRLQAAVDRLSPQLKSVFVLHRVEGLSHEQVAQRLRITALSSKTYMVRALIALRGMLDEDI